jgi:hypothetical protein
MPVKVSIDRGKGLITRTVRDEVTIEEIVKSLEETLDDPRFRPGMKSLTDLRQLSHRWTSDDVTRIVQLVVDNQARLAGGRAAVVVSRTVSYGMIRMLQSRVDGVYQIQVFYDMDEAKQWLGIA